MSKKHRKSFTPRLSEKHRTMVPTTLVPPSPIPAAFLENAIERIARHCVRAAWDEHLNINARLDGKAGIRYPSGEELDELAANEFERVTARITAAIGKFLIGK